MLLCQHYNVTGIVRGGVDDRVRARFAGVHDIARDDDPPPLSEVAPRSTYSPLDSIVSVPLPLMLTTGDVVSTTLTMRFLVTVLPVASIAVYVYRPIRTKARVL